MLLATSCLPRSSVDKVCRTVSDGLPRQAERAVCPDERRQIVDSRRDVRTHLSAAAREFAEVPFVPLDQRAPTHDLNATPCDVARRTLARRENASAFLKLLPRERLPELYWKPPIDVKKKVAAAAAGLTRVTLPARNRRYIDAIPTGA